MRAVGRLGPYVRAQGSSGGSAHTQANNTPAKVVVTAHPALSLGVALAAAVASCPAHHVYELPTTPFQLTRLSVRSVDSHHRSSDICDDIEE